MFRPGKFTAVAVTAVAVVGLSAGSAFASQAASRPAPHVAIHGTGGLHPNIHVSRGSLPATSSQGVPIQYSGNWSGYLATPKKSHAQAFRYVSADYSVPSVNCSTTNYAFAYQWVGLDGDTDGTVEQDGVGSYCVSGQPTYFAWSEMYPAGVDVQFYLNAGDAVTSSVYYDSTTKEYELDLTDLTSGQNFAVDETCASTCKNSTAEVITEGYPSSPYDGTADFGMEQYNSIKVTDRSGQRGSLVNSNWTLQESIAVNGSKQDDTEPGALYSASEPSSPALSAFGVQWLRED